MIKIFRENPKQNIEELQQKRRNKFNDDDFETIGPAEFLNELL